MCVRMRVCQTLNKAPSSQHRAIAAASQVCRICIVACLCQGTVADSCFLLEFSRRIRRHRNVLEPCDSPRRPRQHKHASLDCLSAVSKQVASSHELHGVPEQRERESAQHWRVFARTSRGWDGQQACFPCCPSSMLKQECFRGTGKRAAAALTLEKVITLENVLILESVRRCACRWHTRVPGCHCAPCSVLFHHTILKLSSLRRNEQHLCLRRRVPAGRWRRSHSSKPPRPPPSRS